MPEDKAEQVVGQEERDLRRKPFVQTPISEITADQRKVSIIGTIISKNAELYSFLVDDGTGTILILTNNIERFNEIKEKDFVRVMGRVWGESEEIELQADIIQDFSKIDKELWKKPLGKLYK